MNHLKIAVRLLAAAVLAAALPAVFGSPATHAQTPDAYVAACSPSATPLQPPAIPTDAQLQQWQTQFAQGLSQALNVPVATVQQALSTEAASPAFQPPTTVQDPLVAVSSQLNVSVDTLRNAVQGADQTVLCFGGLPTGPDSGNAFFMAGPGAPSPIDPSAFFAAVAQNLGQGLTGQQVQSAFAANTPHLPDASTLTTDLQNQLSQLATGLGVSTDALKSAIQSMAASGGCLPPNTLGGFRVETKRVANGQQPPTTAGSGQIVIPIANNALPRLPGTPGDPLGLGLAPCGIDSRPDL